MKIDTDRYVGPETATVRCEGEAIGHVTTAEYGSQMLSLGGVHHLTGGSKKEGVVTCDALLALCNREPVELAIDDGSTVVVQADRPPVVNGTREERMRVGCGSAAIGMFAPQWQGHVDEVIVVDDHITGVLSEHQGGRFLDMKPAGIRVRGRKSTPGRYFQVAEPGLGWGGTNVSDPLEIIEKIDPQQAWPGLKLLMVSTTGGRSACTTTVEPSSIASSTASRLHSAKRASQVTTPSFLLPPTRWCTPPSDSICEPYSAVVTWPTASPLTRTAACSGPR